MFAPHAWGCTGVLYPPRRPLGVCPTRVGMHRAASRRWSATISLPHTRGDAPRPRRIFVGAHTFAPHAWGCTARLADAVPHRGVCPTRVGMHRRRAGDSRLRKCLPHTRGDAPPGPDALPPRRRFAPHAWGCTPGQRRRRVADLVCPTRVGMHRSGAAPTPKPTGLPHTRGDAPPGSAANRSCERFAPHAWGCTRAFLADPDAREVCPTRVGMHRTPSTATAARAGLPHTRGDAPHRRTGRWRSGWFAPHAWGCTVQRAVHPVRRRVCPTRVGMHRLRRRRAPPARRLPHTRGDAPDEPLPPAFSTLVCPTRVGMHRAAARRRSPPTRLPHTRGDAPRASASRMRGI